MRIEIPKQVEWILGQLKKNGYEAFVVGGCVRDVLLGRVPEDWDITTSAQPEAVKRIFGKTIDTGLKHGTVTVLKDRRGYEITTYRIDGEYEDGRHPKEVEFTSDLREDLRRRDFTINAMAYSHETGVVDVFGGMEDLERKVIRCVGNATERFTEDALRILRAIRFSAQLGFSIEEQTYAALSDIAPNLAHVSKERIQTELTKTLLSPHPERIFLTEATGMAPYISETFPEVFRRMREASVTEAELSRAAELKEDKALRYAAFLSCTGERTAETVLKELKMDNAATARVKTLAGRFDEPLPGERPALRRVMSGMGGSAFDDLLELKRVMRPETEAEVLRAERLSASIRENGDCLSMKELAVTGNDLLKAGMRPGPQLGKTLEMLFEAVLTHPEYNRKEYLLKYLKELEHDGMDENMTEQENMAE